MEVRVLLPQPFFGSQALTVKPPALTRQNSEHLTRATRLGPLAPTCWLAAPLRFAEASHHFGSMAQQSAQLPHKEKAAGANPARAPIFFEAWQSSKCSAL